MTPHEKALEAAVADLGEPDEFSHWQLDYGNLNHFAAKYLTTLLDSPEMVEKIARAMMQPVFHEIDPSTAPLDWTGNDIWGCDFGEMAENVIAEIKKEVGIL
jgi:hypothetical protein